MFLPVEGLYAEVLRDMDTVTAIQSKYRVVVAGPTTLGALLNSLQIGFKTLAIQKRSGEIKHLLSSIISDFMGFSVMLEKTKKKLDEASNTIEKAVKKSNTIQKRLKNVQKIEPDKDEITDENDDDDDQEDQNVESEAEEIE